MIDKNLEIIINELTEGSKYIDSESIIKLSKLIIDSDRLFVTGAGRSGCVARAFANRLLHLGFDVHFVGEITTPPIKKGDLIIAGSGSGITPGVLSQCKKAKELGARVATITLSPEGDIGQLSDLFIKLPGTTRNSNNNSISSAQPVGTLFEQLSWLVYDSIVMTIKELTNQTNDMLIERHGNLE